MNLIDLYRIKIEKKIYKCKSYWAYKFALKFHHWLFVEILESIQCIDTNIFLARHYSSFQFIFPTVFHIYQIKILIADWTLIAFIFQQNTTKNWTKMKIHSWNSTPGYEHISFSTKVNGHLSMIATIAYNYPSFNRTYGHYISATYELWIP